MISKSFKVTSESGIHARLATSLVNEVVKYDSEISISVNGKKVDFKSIMGVMSLGIYNGETITIDCNGIDENEAMDGITNCIFELRVGQEK